MFRRGLLVLTWVFLASDVGQAIPFTESFGPYPPLPSSYRSRVFRACQAWMERDYFEIKYRIASTDRTFGRLKRQLDSIWADIEVGSSERERVLYELGSEGYRSWWLADARGRLEAASSDTQRWLQKVERLKAASNRGSSACDPYTASLMAGHLDDLRAWISGTRVNLIQESMMIVMGLEDLVQERDR